MEISLPNIRNAEVKGKRVLLRVDFNVLFSDGKVEDLYRINKTIPTIEYLSRKGAKVIIISHLSAGKNGSLASVAKYLNSAGKSFSLGFIKATNLDLIAESLKGMKDGDIAMLENIRLHKEEEENDDNFAKTLSKLGDIFVNDAFSASHRKHASIVGVPKYLPSYAGFLFEEEVNGLQSAFSPERPFLLLLGGVKAETKLGVIDRFLNIADKIFIGGALANNFLKAKGMDIGSSVLSENIPMKKYLNNEKIYFPADVRMKDGKIYDIGEKAVEEVLSLVQEAKFILWSGPMGNIEEDDFDKGTKIIANAIANSKAKTIIGGGDTVAVLNEMGILDKFSFVSTAGGAMLEFLASGTLPGIEALLTSQNLTSFARLA